MQIGAMLAGRFEVVSMLAHGGMSDVVEARDVMGGGQHVAVKLLREGFAEDPEVVLRFEREARIASTLKSRHVVKILDCGVAEGCRPFIVTELLTGVSLSRELGRRSALPVEEAALYVAQACHAMIEAHDAGIVHRDLKPSNLFLCQDGGKRMVKVLDFGIARMAPEQGDDPLTHTKSMFGTPLYMSPESFRSAKASDARSDVWSLGVIFYECLTGAVPFHAETGLGVGLAVTRENHLAPTLRRKDLPHSTDVVLARALKKDPKQRYQSVRELMAALELYLPRGRNETMELRRVVDPHEIEIENDTTTQRGLGPRAPMLSDPETCEAPTKIGHQDAHEAPTRVGHLDADDVPTRIAHSQPPTLTAPAAFADVFEPVPHTLIVSPEDDDSRDSVPGTLVMDAAQHLASHEPLIVPVEPMSVPVPATTRDPSKDSREFDLEKLSAEISSEISSDEPMTGVARRQLSSLPNVFGDPERREESVRPAPPEPSLPPPPPRARRQIPLIAWIIPSAVLLVSLAWIVARMLPRPAPHPSANPAAAMATAEADSSTSEPLGAELPASAAVTAEPLAVPTPTTSDPEPVASESASADLSASATLPVATVSASATASVSASASGRPRGPKPKPKPPPGTPPPKGYDPTDI